MRKPPTNLGGRRATKGVSAAAFLLGAFLGLACAAQRPATPEKARDDYRKTLGIEAQSLRLAASGMVADFRYRIVDPAKAVALQKPGAVWTLVESDTGRVHPVPAPAYVGPLRQRNERPQAGRVQFVLFDNHDRTLAPGSRVQIRILDASILAVVEE
jgi:hypothetical protein